MIKSRLEQIESLREKGWSYEMIGRKFRLSRQRVHQLILKGKADRGEMELPKYLQRYSIVQLRELNPKQFPPTGICPSCYRNIYTPKGKLCRVCSSAVSIFTGRERAREVVRMRDDHTCQMCGKVWDKSKRRFDVHHLNGLCGKRSRGCDKIEDMPGLVTLCHKCHFNHHQFSKILDGTRNVKSL